MQFKTTAQREEFAAWVKQAIDHMADHVRRQELLAGDFRGMLAWSIPGEIAIARFWENENPDGGLWLIGGQVPVEHLRFEHAGSPREAARQFVMKWQLQAAQLAEGDSDSAVNFTDAAKRLTGCAEALYALTTHDKLWEANLTAEGNSVRIPLQN
ncbi:MAG: DUF4826 family protein [Gammaproteobacteria bacterium]|nr:DUF4826 family protein [Gammaproteobacteria bacterium]